MYSLKELKRLDGEQNLVEHIKRTCSICGFSWDEAPLDKQPTQFTAKEAADKMEAMSPLRNPTIEVGDVVFCRECLDAACKVIGADTSGYRCALQNTMQPWCVCDSIDSDSNPLRFKDLTLIRKGPKVITLKEMMLEEFITNSFGVNCEGNIIKFRSQIEYSDTEEPVSKALSAILRKGCNYTMTLTEETD
jgi:hypothetical protein